MDIHGEKQKYNLKSYFSKDEIYIIKTKERDIKSFNLTGQYKL